MIRLENVELKLPTVQRPLLKDISYVIAPQDFIILLGSNGSGKSTLLKVLHQQCIPTAGRLHFHGEMRAKQSMAVLTQHVDAALFTSLTVFENMMLIKGRASLSRAEASAYIADFNPQLSQKLDTLVCYLSGGEKQALALALQFIYPPRLLLLDEHTSALDPKTAVSIMQLTEKLIAQYKITCVLTTHDLDIALKFGNRLVMLQGGKIAHAYDQAAKFKLDKKFLIESYL